MRTAIMAGFCSYKEFLMNFSDFVVPAAIRADLDAVDKRGVVREVVRALAEAGAIAGGNRSSIVNAVMRREELGSTAMGHGAAVPRARHRSVDRVIAAVAVSREGVDFDSLDGEPTHVFFLLVSSPDRPQEHGQALAMVTGMLRDPMFRNALRQASTAEQIKQVLDKTDLHPLPPVRVTMNA